MDEWKAMLGGYNMRLAVMGRVEVLKPNKGQDESRLGLMGMRRTAALVVRDADVDGNDGR